MEADPSIPARVVVKRPKRWGFSSLDPSTDRLKSLNEHAKRSMVMAWDVEHPQQFTNKLPTYFFLDPEPSFEVGLYRVGKVE